MKENCNLSQLQFLTYKWTRPNTGFVENPKELLLALKKLGMFKNAKSN